MRLISANALIELANSRKDGTVDANDIARFPSIKAELVRYGEWKEWWPGSCALILTGEEMLWQCSECGSKYSDVENMHYCPNCGAKMDGAEADDR